jgi:hypothetical protein
MELKTIDLGRGFVAMVDAEDYERLSQWKWNAQISRNTVYAVRSVRGSTYYMHRELFPDSDKVDHEDGNGLNNCRYNLRPCSQSNNMRNTRKHKVGTSKFKGAHFNKRKQVWQSYICIPKRTHLGYYSTEVEAALAYNFAAAHHFGEFARLNEVHV